MGQKPSQIRNFFEKNPFKRPKKVVILGLNKAGKTTLLSNLLVTGNDIDVANQPTTACNKETMTLPTGKSLTLWDLGGQLNHWTKWKPHCKDAKGLVFVVDSSDRERFPEVKEEFFSILEDKDMPRVPTVVIANKQDLPDAAPGSEVTTLFDLHLGHIKCPVLPVSAKNDEGIREAMDEIERLVTR